MNTILDQNTEELLDPILLETLRKWFPTICEWLQIDKSKIMLQYAPRANYENSHVRIPQGWESPVVCMLSSPGTSELEYRWQLAGLLYLAGASLNKMHGSEKLQPQYADMFIDEFSEPKAGRYEGYIYYIDPEEYWSSESEIINGNLATKNSKTIDEPFKTIAIIIASLIVFANPLLWIPAIAFLFIWQKTNWFKPTEGLRSK